MVDVYEHLGFSPRAQSNRELCGLGGVGSFSHFCPLDDGHHLYSLDGWGSDGFLHSQATYFSIWCSSGQSKNAISLSPTRGRHGA